MDESLKMTERGRDRERERQRIKRPTREGVGEHKNKTKLNFIWFVLHCGYENTDRPLSNSVLSVLTQILRIADD